jgi:uncharacterized protein
MELFLICTVAFLASAITLFSGFGLGTLLLPAFALFFPVEVAIAMTAIVHLLNNFFKLYLFHNHIDRNILIGFGLPAVFAALLGAWLLQSISEKGVIYSYVFNQKTYTVTLIKFVIGILMIIFALFELLPFFKKISFGRKWLPVGGLLSGFFGGLSGHQGALRSAFLIKLNISKEVFIASGVAVACLIDISRLIIYATDFGARITNLNFSWLAAATAAAFAGAFLGNELLKKITIGFLQVFVAVLILVFASALVLGFV